MKITVMLGNQSPSRNKDKCGKDILLVDSRMMKLCTLHVKDHGPKQTLDAFYLFYFYLEVRKEQKRKNGRVCGRQ